MAIVDLILLAASIFHLVFGVSGEETDYIIIPTNMSHYGGNGPHFLHIYVTGSHDTDVEITIPTTTFSERFSLTGANKWAWKNEYVLDTVNLSMSMEKGFRVKASESLSIYVTRNVSERRTSVTSFIALPVNEESKSHFLSPYMRRQCTSCTSWRYETFYVVAASARGATVDVSRYNISDGIPSNILHRNLGPYEVLFQSISDGAIDDGIGLEVNATDPVAVYAGNRWIQIPYESRGASTNNYIQIPDVNVLQKEFIIGPFPGNLEPNGYSVLIVFAHEETVVKVLFNIDTTITIRRSNHSCSCVTFAGGCNLNCSLPLTRGAYVEFTTNSPSLPIIVNCSKPCQTLTLKHTHSTNLPRPLGLISLVASPKLRSSDLRIFVPDMGEPETVRQSYINIAVPLINYEFIFVDGDSIMDSINGISQYILGDWTVVIVPVFPGVHVLQFRGGDISVAVHVHGAFFENCTNCYLRSFGFPAIFQVNDEVTQTTSVPTIKDTITTSFSSASHKSTPDSIKPDTSSSSMMQTMPSVAGRKRISQFSNIDIVNLSLILLTMVGMVAVVVYVCRRFSSKPKRPRETAQRYDTGTSKCVKSGQ